jgi:protein-S-isoprenylcysteine O-methyltransferase Ste14
VKPCLGLWPITRSHRQHQRPIVIWPSWVHPFSLSWIPESEGGIGLTLLLTFSANETDKSNAPLIVLGRVLIGMLWVGWAAYWIVTARHTMTNRRTESLLTGASYRVLLALGVILLASPGYHLSLANFFLWPQSAFTLAIGLCLTVCGLSIAVWARHHLGKYWSDRITLKADHRVIQNGSYAFVLHPIYSGILLALLGTVISFGTVQSCIGLAIIFVSFVRKPTLEEQWLCAHLGAAPCEGTHSVRIVTWALQNGIRLRNDRYSSSGASGLRRERIAGGYQL